MLMLEVCGDLRVTCYVYTHVNESYVICKCVNTTCINGVMSHASDSGAVLQVCGDLHVTCYVYTHVDESCVICKCINITCIKEVISHASDSGAALQVCFDSCVTWRIMYTIKWICRVSNVNVWTSHVQKKSCHMQVTQGQCFKSALICAWRDVLCIHSCEWVVCYL